MVCPHRLGGRGHALGFDAATGVHDEAGREARRYEASGVIVLLTEAELWKLAAQPAIFAIAMLSFLKTSWRVRLMAAVGAAAAGLAIGLIAMWAERSGIPWLGWVFAANCAAYLVWRLIKRRRAAAYGGLPRGRGDQHWRARRAERGSQSIAGLCVSHCFHHAVQPPLESGRFSIVGWRIWRRERRCAE